jgi:streptomycin 6-kinase
VGIHIHGCFTKSLNGMSALRRVSSVADSLQTSILLLTMLRDRLHDYADRWSVTLDDSLIETASSIIGFGMQRERPVALKVVKRQGDEWLAGSVTRAFDGHGVVRVLETDAGAVLLERAIPGTSLVDVVAAGDDDRATSIIAGIIRELSPRDPPTGAQTVEDWGRGFDRHRATGDGQIPSSLMSEAHALYRELCVSQTDHRLLHGDLQHSNVLFDRDRGWIAIDPKGVIGEPEVEVGPFLRNPTHAVELFSNRKTVERRLQLLCERAALRYERALRWSFALAVLSAIWCVEDDGVVHDDNPALILAGALRSSIERAGS